MGCACASLKMYSRRIEMEFLFEGGATNAKIKNKNAQSPSRSGFFLKHSGSNIPPPPPCHRMTLTCQADFATHEIGLGRYCEIDLVENNPKERKVFSQVFLEDKPYFHRKTPDHGFTKSRVQIVHRSPKKKKKTELRR